MATVIVALKQLILMFFFSSIDANLTPVQTHNTPIAMASLKDIAEFIFNYNFKHNNKKATLQTQSMHNQVNGEIRNNDDS